ncbi:histidine kinase [Streptomyces sp. MJP52]|uniref:sensor histidine kinase n=1 Tax=Streptomyces sp. MJP52 TaxID=2940555 RepID=UPI0024743ADA|nr:histidine kinase [Streptomyces sp. MJP52]MDH6226172.1 two-component system sensor histidine kinase DesK [Streptomyces sp. MJP52]
MWQWWGKKSTPAKVETYTRWSFHGFALTEAVCAVPLAAPLGLPDAVPVVLIVLGHAALCAVTASRALDWTRGTRDHPRNLVYALAVMTAAVAVTAVLLAGRADEEHVRQAAGSVFAMVLAFGGGIMVLGIRDRARVPAAVAGFGVGTGAVTLADGTPVAVALVISLLVLLITGFMAFTSVFTVWLLSAVYELDEARENRARLAVAEERLRFGRDLHDVLGRNLAVIALKAELSVELARRGRPEAVDQMTEVERIAQESQREVRAVVRGYRRADLGVEIAGARGVLEAAGIVCEVSVAPLELPAETQSALAWVVREATTNVLRHGNARRCVVTAGRKDGRVVLTVENDGARTAGGTGGSGLAGLRERLAAVGGTLTAGRDGDTFRLVAEVPARAAGQERRDVLEAAP